jgi:hypothetical protein
MTPRVPDPRGWEADFEGTRRWQLRRFRSLTLREKLQALEDMSELAARLQRRPGSVREPTGPYRPTGERRPGAAP